MATRYETARSQIHGWFEATPQKVFSREELSRVFKSNRSLWRLPYDMTANAFIGLLKEDQKLFHVRFNFPHNPTTRFTWGKVSIFEIVASLRPKGYLSHYSAVFLHGLTEQIPKTIYLNDEQAMRSQPDPSMTQARIDAALSRRQRQSNNRVELEGYTIVVVNGGNTGRYGVVTLTGPMGEVVEATNLERTLFDIAVRPAYAGGVQQVLDAYRVAGEKGASVNKLVATIKQLDFTYPYHQAIGYYLERAGTFPPDMIEFFRSRFEYAFDFYLTYAMRETTYNDRWRLYVPRGF